MPKPPSQRSNRLSASSVAGVIAIRYYTAVWLDRITLPYFFTLSLAAHLALMPLLARKPFSPAQGLDPIAVTIMPPPPVERPHQPTLTPALFINQTRVEGHRRLCGAQPTERLAFPDLPAVLGWLREGYGIDRMPAAS